jgi:hypothetical protein
VLLRERIIGMLEKGHANDRRENELKNENK